MKNRKRDEHNKRRTKPRRFFIRLHPLFIIVGVIYAFVGDLTLFLLSCLVALQHECAHAFGASKLGYSLNAVVLMPYGAVIDGDIQGISFRDEIYVALCGPVCNLITAFLFGALWWFFPTLYAYTDTAFYASIGIALVNLLPAYPLDGGRILFGVLARSFVKGTVNENQATRKAKRVCLGVSIGIVIALIGLFIATIYQGNVNFSLLLMALFLLFGGKTNTKDAVYTRIDFAGVDIKKKGALLRRVAVWDGCPIKDVIKYIARGEYLVLEVYDETEKHLFDLPQNKLSKWFLQAKTPYDTLGALYKKNIKN